MDLTGIPFTKVYRSMLTSSVWTTPHPNLHMIRCVWMTLMLMADRHGFVHSSVPGLAAQAVVTIEEAQEALEVFRSPDPYSRTKDQEGRKLIDVEGGWFLLNYQTHRELTREERAKESKRAWYHRQKASKTREPVLVVPNPELLDAQPSLSSSDPDQSLAGPEQSGSTRTGASLAADRARIVAETDAGLAAFGEAMAQNLGEIPSAQGQRAIHRSLDGWLPRPEHYTRATEIGLPRDVFDARLADLRNGPIGGARGVFDRDDYVMRQLPKWKVWHETAQSQAVHRPGSTNGHGPGPRRGGILRSVLEPTGKHRAFAEKHGLDLAAMTREIEESGAIDELGAKRALEILGQKMSKAARDKGGSG